MRETFFTESRRKGTQFIDTGLSLEFLFISISNNLRGKFELFWLYFIFNKAFHFLQFDNLEILLLPPFFVIIWITNMYQQIVNSQ
jgi:hypothetical protein